MCHGQLISQALVKARKRHQCDACLEWVEAGCRYVRTTAKVEGDFQMSRVCPRCQAMLEAYYSELDVGEACFALQDLRSIVREELRATGTWAKFKAAMRAALKRGPKGAWHT